MIAELEKAAVAIAKEEWRAALEHLLLAWRASRHERLAAVIDRVSSHLPAEPITAKTVIDRTFRWLQLAKKADPNDIGTLIATPWPGKWQDCSRLVLAYDAFPTDPRIAMALATFATAAPFDHRPSMKLYEDVLRILGKCRDSRTRPMLEKELANRKSPWSDLVKRICQSTLSMIENRPLAAAEEAAIANVESLFASEVRTEATNEKSEADFLAAIYASPDDDALRAVYADWLTERGDPRGEFITLQLNGDDRPKAKKREATLLKKHGAAFAGALDRAFSKDGRVWTRGFLSGGIVYDREELLAELAHPEWALIDTLYVAGDRGASMEALLAAPWLGNLRSLTGVSETMIARMAAAGPGANLEEIHMVVDAVEDLERRQRIAKGFPRLQRFGIGHDREPTLAYLAGPLPRVERLLVLSQRIYWPEVLAAIPASVPVFEMRGAFGVHHQWCFELSRDASGRFTKLRARPSSPEHTLPGSRALAYAVESMPDLEELVVEPGAGVEWDRDGLASIEAALIAAKNLRVIEVPWDRGVGPRDADAPRIKLQCRGREHLERDLDEIWHALTSAPLGLSFDSMSVNFGAHGPLEGDALARVKAAIAKKRTHSVAVYRKSTPETMVAIFRGPYLELTIPRGPDFDLDAWLAWLMTLLDRVDLPVVAAPFLMIDDGGVVRVRYTKSVGPEAEPLRWLMGFADVARFDALVAAVKNVAGVRAVRGQRNLLWVFGDSPDEHLSADAENAIDVALREALG